MSHPWKHFKTITKHRHKVMGLCRRVGIGYQGLFHDLSKYSPTEFIPGAKYYLGTRSPNERERELFGYSAAWLHHKGRNKHHYEYWYDVNMQKHIYEPVKMPVRWVAEMFCDRVAASKIYGGDAYTDAYAYDYFVRGEAGKKMHPETAALLESWLILLRDRGEEAALDAVRRAVATEKKQKKDHKAARRKQHTNLRRIPASKSEKR